MHDILFPGVHRLEPLARHGALTYKQRCLVDLHLPSRRQCTTKLEAFGLGNVCSAFCSHRPALAIDLDSIPSHLDHIAKEASLQEQLERNPLAACINLCRQDATILGLFSHRHTPATPRVVCMHWQGVDLVAGLQLLETTATMNPTHYMLTNYCRRGFLQSQPGCRPDQ